LKDDALQYAMSAERCSRNSDEASAVCIVRDEASISC